MHNAVCRSQVETYQDARKVETDLGLSIVDFLDGTVGGNLDESSFRSVKDQFCALDFSTASSTDRAILSVRRASATLANAFTDCVTRAQGFFGWVTQTKDRRAFAIELRYVVDGDNRFAVEEISYAPTSIKCKRDAHLATREQPYLAIGSASIGCENLEPEKSFQLIANTTVGTVRAVEIVGLDETLGNLTERVQKLEGRAVPSGAVAWFEDATCPGGWTLYEKARGRTIVGADNAKNKDARNVLISRWGVGDVGGEEKHQLSESEMPRHHHVTTLGRSRYLQGGSHIALDQETTNHDLNTSGVGSNQPHNTMPPFVALTPCVKQ